MTLKCGKNKRSGHLAAGELVRPTRFLSFICHFRVISVIHNIILFHSYKRCLKPALPQSKHSKYSR